MQDHNMDPYQEPYQRQYKIRRTRYGGYYVIERKTGKRRYAPTLDDALFLARLRTKHKEQSDLRRRQRENRRRERARDFRV